MRGWSVLFCLGLWAGVIPTALAQPHDPYWISLEGGPAWQSRNDARIPGTTGTLFSLVDFGVGPFWTIRLYGGWRPSPDDEFRLLLAPLSVNLSGLLTQPITFEQRTFPAGSLVDATYQFHSYRLTYKRRWMTSDSWEAWIGFTAKIRDAKIALLQNGVTTQNTNVGFVPLVHVAAAYRLLPDCSLGIDADAIWSPYGRAEDMWMGALIRFAPGFTGTLGYRMVEGGADVAAAYAFAWIHYAASGLAISF